MHVITKEVRLREQNKKTRKKIREDATATKYQQKRTIKDKKVLKIDLRHNNSYDAVYSHIHIHTLYPRVKWNGTVKGDLNG